ncbi:MAG: ABC-2 transporter permease [Desulfuromonadia bacterium]
MSIIIQVTLKGIFRDRVFQGIMVLALLLLAVPSAASLSMRQVTELSITLSLSIISFILLLLSVFLGGTVIWKDIERRYTFSVLTLPVSRTAYLVSRFLGISLFLCLTSTLLGGVSLLVVKAASTIYPPDRPVVYGYIVVSILFSTLKYILVVAVAMLLSTVSTSFFLPIFGTICTVLASGVSQEVYDYLLSPASRGAVHPFVRSLASAVYYLIPNFAGFDLKVNAIYAIPPNPQRLFLSVGYFFAWVAILLGGASLLFQRREMK